MSIKHQSAEVVALNIVANYDGEWDDGFELHTSARKLEGTSAIITFSDEEGESRAFRIDVKEV